MFLTNHTCSVQLFTHAATAHSVLVQTSPSVLGGTTPPGAIMLVVLATDPDQMGKIWVKYVCISDARADFRIIFACVVRGVHGTFMVLVYPFVAVLQPLATLTRHGGQK